MVATLRERVLDESLTAPLASIDDALLLAGATQHLESREQLLRRLHAEGVVVIDTPPAHLHTALVREYLLIKRSGRL
jgi:hypothetical protein